MIVIPAIDVRAGRVVRLVRGRPDAETRYSDDPAATAASFAEQGATWLHVVDLDAAFGRGDNRVSLRSILQRVATSVQVGGGLRSQEAVDAAVDEGAARVVLGTAAIRDETFLRDAVDRHGERIAVALDVDGGEVRVEGWMQGAGAVDGVLDALRDAGAPRFVVTQVERDGTLAGPDLELLRRLVRRLDRPVIASGGVRDAQDLRAVAGTGVEAVVVGRALYEGTLTLSEAMEVVG